MSYNDLKPEPNRRIYIEILRKMTPEQRIMKAMELTDMAKMLLWEGLKTRYPDMPETELKKIYLKEWDKGYNQNYWPCHINQKQNLRAI